MKYEAYFVNLNRNTSSVIVDTDFALLTINSDFYGVHVGISLLVIRSIDYDLVEYLVKTWHIANFFHLHRVHLGVVNPHLLLSSFDRPYICIWSLEDVFELGKLYHVLAVIKWPSGNDLTFWYCSELELLVGFASVVPSKATASFSSSCRGLPTAFFGAGPFFCFLALGGVAESRESSCRDPRSGAESSSSVSGLALFFDAVGFSFDFNVV